MAVPIRRSAERYKPRRQTPRPEDCAHQEIQPGIVAGLQRVIEAAARQVRACLSLDRTQKFRRYHAADVDRGSHRSPHRGAAGKDASRLRQAALRDAWSTPGYCRAERAAGVAFQDLPSRMIRRTPATPLHRLQKLNADGARSQRLLPPGPCPQGRRADSHANWRPGTRRNSEELGRRLASLALKSLIARTLMLE